MAKQSSTPSLPAGGSGEMPSYLLQYLAEHLEAQERGMHDLPVPRKAAVNPWVKVEKRAQNPSQTKKLISLRSSAFRYALPLRLIFLSVLPRSLPADDFVPCKGDS